MVPFDIRGQAPFMWPGKKTKLVFLSATMNHKDLERIGLEDRRWVHVKVGSPIPPENRPIYLDSVAPMGAHQQKKNLPILLDYVEQVWTNYGKSRGLVHIPYSLAEQLRKIIPGNDYSPATPLSQFVDSKRLPLFFHSNKNKQSQFNSWLKSPNGILIASGMTEGLDLVGDLARWQVIGKIPWPSLMDPVIEDWARRDPSAYVWETLKQVIQATGRVCRGPEDFGATHIFDNHINKLLDSAEDAKLIPEWWGESLIEMKGGVRWRQISLRT
jgi:Rad3-related DNA helicase